MKSEWGKQMNPTSLWHPYWLNLPHDWFCRLGCSKRTKANQKWKLFCVSYSLFSWVRRLEIGKCHLLICWGGNSWPLCTWQFGETYIAKGTAETNGLICPPYQQQHPCHHLLSTSTSRMDVLRCHVSESIRISLVTLTNSCWETIISPNRSWLFGIWGYGTFMYFLFVSTFSAFIHYKHFFADLPSMLVTGCGPQEIEKYCLLLPGCNIVLDKVLEIFFIRYHR